MSLTQATDGRGSDVVRFPGVLGGRLWWSGQECPWTLTRGTKIAGRQRVEAAINFIKLVVNFVEIECLI